MFFDIASCFPRNDKPYFDTDCINLLNNIWKLDKKKLDVAYVNFYFDDPSNKVITPMKNANKMGDKGSRWKSAYQAVKHHRTRDISKGNIKNLIHAMGALFILNIYYRNESYNVNSEKDFSFTNSLSSIFKPKVSTFNGFSSDGQYSRVGATDESLYLIKYEKNYENNMLQWFNKQNEILSSMLLKHPKILKHIHDKLKASELDESYLLDFFGNRKYLDCLDFEHDYVPIVKKSSSLAAKEAHFKLDFKGEYVAVVNKE